VSRNTIAVMIVGIFVSFKNDYASFTRSGSVAMALAGLNVTLDSVERPKDTLDGSSSDGGRTTLTLGRSLRVDAMSGVSLEPESLSAVLASSPPFRRKPL